VLVGGSSPGYRQEREPLTNRSAQEGQPWAAVRSRSGVSGYVTASAGNKRHEHWRHANIERVVCGANVRVRSCVGQCGAVVWEVRAEENAELRGEKTVAAEAVRQASLLQHVAER